MSEGDDEEVKQIRSRLNALVGRPALLPEEDPAEFEELAERISRGLEVADLMQRLIARDIAYLHLEVLRYRTLKVRRLEAMKHVGVERLLTTLGTKPGERERLKNGWARREPKAVREVKTILEKAGLDDASITAETFIADLDNLERLNRLLSVAEAQRNKALRDYAQYSDDTEMRADRRRARRERTKQITAVGR